MLWYYPHEIFPGITSQGEPPLGHMFLGLSCLLSGEDFSRVSEIVPMFYPGREDLIGREMVAAQNFCHFPIFAFGLLFAIIMSVLAFTMLSRYSAMFVTAFFAFNPFILNFSRYIHVDMILWFFLGMNLYLLYKFYRSQKYSGKEKIFLALSAISLGLAGATKLSFGVFIFFSMFIVAEKYLDEVKKILKQTLNFKFEIGETNIKSLVILGIIFSILFWFFFLLPFQLNPANVSAVYASYQGHSPGESGISFNPNIFSFIINSFLYEINILDGLLFLFSLFILVYLIFNKKTKAEKFILYYVGMLVISAVLFKALHSFTRVALPYLFSLIFLMSLAFSERRYSILNFFKGKKRFVFFGFMIIYIIYSLSIAIPSIPYFEYANPVVCKISKEPCNPPLSPYAARDLGNLTNSIMEDNETFILQPPELFFYSRPEQGGVDWNFYVAFTQQVGREPTLTEKMELFRPNNRTVRYLIVDPLGGNKYQDEIDKINNVLEPNHKLILKKREIFWIYDIENPIRKVNETKDNSSNTGIQ